MSWTTISLEDLEEDKAYKFEPHHQAILKGLPYTVCVKCGLLYLNNNITKKCISLGCEHEKHPEYIK